LAHGPLPNSRRLIYSPPCGVSKLAVLWNPRTGRSKPSGKSFAMPWQPGGRSATRPPIFAVRFHQRARAASQRSPIPKASELCYEPSKVIKVLLLPVVPYSLPHWFSCGPASYARQNGPNSTLTARNGASLVKKMKMREKHIVPLSVQAVAILRELHPLTGGGRYVLPDFGCEDYYGKGIFAREDFQRLAGIQGKFMLSINDTPEIREIFRPFLVREVETRYSVGAAKRGDPVRELLVMNYEP
jgi:hypothetical protein